MPIDISIINHHPGKKIEPAAAGKLVRRLLADEALQAREISIILADDAYLQRLHRDYLDDDTATDVITFNLGDTAAVEGEIYISLDRAAAHAAEFAVSPEEEIARLIIHGILHLKGYDDDSAGAQARMRAKEEHYLAKYPAAIKFSI